MEARALNYEPESLSSPLAPLVNDKNEVLNNFPTNIQSLNEMQSRLLSVL